jgi:hypothetical protein
MKFEILSIGQFKDCHKGETATVVGRGPTEYDYKDLENAPGPVFFINDAVQFDQYVSGDSYLFAVDKPMAKLLEYDLHSLPILPYTMENSIRPVRSEFNSKIVFYEYKRTPNEQLLNLNRDELAALGEMYSGVPTVLTAIHFIWFCGCTEIVFVGCDGVNDADGLKRLGDREHGYDARMKNLSATKPGWLYAKIRAAQDITCRRFGIRTRYLGRPSIPHPNPFYRELPQIPPIAHFIWLGSELPEFTRSNIARFEKLHPDWDIKLWQEIPAEVPTQIKELILKLPLLCTRSDVLRIWLLHEYGGIYVDADVYPVRSFSELRHFTHFFCTENGGTTATNCVVGTSPKSELTRQLMDALFEACRRPEPPTARTAFGPRLYSGLMRKFGSSVNALPHHYFCSIQNHDRAFALTQRPFTKIHDFLVSSETEWEDNTWPYGIHTYGIPGDQIEAPVERSSWA